jgi:hypothetical protein
MTRQRYLIGIGVLCSLALAVLLFRGEAEPVYAASPSERSFPERCALKVVTKNQIIEYVTWPKVERMGGRAFVGGYRVNSGASVWLPMEDVSFIEEYGTREEMEKAYPGLAPKKDEPPKPDGMVQVVAPDVPPKKN